MTRALITKLVDALEDSWNPTLGTAEREEGANEAITAAREYLATEPRGERAALIAKLRTGWTVMEESEFERLDDLCRKAADMLEANAQQATPDIKALQSNGKGPAPCARFCEANAFQIEIRRLTAEINAQQAKRVPMTEKQIDKIYADTARLAQIRTTFFVAFARAIEAHRGITPADKPTDWSAA